MKNTAVPEGVLTTVLFKSISIGSFSPPQESGGKTSTAGKVLVTQNPNALTDAGVSNSLPRGWCFLETGTGTNITYTAGTGSSTTGDTYSFDAPSSTNRVLGELTTRTLNCPPGASFTNNTGQAITSTKISYTGERGRLADRARTDKIDFQYSTKATSLSTGAWTDVAGLGYTVPVTAGSVEWLDGNAAANRTVLTTTITGVSFQMAHLSGFAGMVWAVMTFHLLHTKTNCNEI